MAEAVGTTAPPGSQAAAQHLDQPLQQQGLPPATGLDAIETEHVGVQPAEHTEPNVLGFADATFLVALAMAVLIGIFLWRRVPQLIASSLDSRIAAIRAQLDEASALRAEAEALRDSYGAKLTAVDAEAEAMRETARHEAAQILEKAHADTDATIARRRRMAEDRIAAAERQAVAEVRQRAARLSAQAAERLLAERVDADIDREMIDRSIGGLGRLT